MPKVCMLTYTLMHIKICIITYGMATISLSNNNNKTRKHRRGILGIESAIVMIAFVVVAAALAFVVLNAGFGTTQKSKTTISEGLKSATGAVEVSGLVTGKKVTFTMDDDSSVTALEYYSIPIKLASGANSVNLQPELTAVKYFSKSVSYDNIYKGVVFAASDNGAFTNVKEAITKANTDGICNYTAASGAAPSKAAKTCAFIWFSNIVGTQNKILDGGEVAVLTIVFRAVDTDDPVNNKIDEHERPLQNDMLHVELIPSGGSVLTVERTVPVLTTDVVNMG
jgi:flagellin FlaB